MTIPGTPDQPANAAVPWILKPVGHNTFSPISDNIQLWTVTTTTEKEVPNKPEPGLDPSQASSTEEHTKKRNETTAQLQSHDSDEYDSPIDDDDLYFKAQRRNPPEMGESNAESAERTTRIEEDVARMKKQRQLRREYRRTHPLKTRMTPPDQYTPLPETHEEYLANPEPYRTHPIWDLLSPIEHYIHKDAISRVSSQPLQAENQVQRRGRIYNDGAERTPNHQTPSHQRRKRDCTPKHTHTQPGAL
jgi:hypothetical protein